MSAVPRDDLTDETLREQLAALEHRQWMHWASNLAEREDLPDHLEDRWEENMVPYADLDEETKEHDRKWARKVIEILEEEGVLDDADGQDGGPTVTRFEGHTARKGPTPSEDDDA